jgi:hypothetical protein
MARGHIRERSNGTFQVLVYAGLDPVTRKQRYLTGTTKTPREAEKLKTRLMAQAEEERRPATSSTVAHLLNRWLEVAELELSTRHNYEHYINRKIIPALDSLPLRKVTVDVWRASTPS